MFFLGDGEVMIVQHIVTCTFRFRPHLISLHNHLSFTQNTMGLPLEKKTGTNFGPPGNSKLVYFLDDLNLSEVRCFCGSWVLESCTWLASLRSRIREGLNCRTVHVVHAASTISGSLSPVIHATYAHAVFRLTRTILNRPLPSCVSTWNTSINTISPSSA